MGIKAFQGSTAKVFPNWVSKWTGTKLIRTGGSKKKLLVVVGFKLRISLSQADRADHLTSTTAYSSNYLLKY